MQTLVYLLPSWGWLILSALFYALGEFLSEKFVLAPGYFAWTILIIADAISITLWLPALYQKNNLAITGTLWLVFAVVATVLLGVLVFREPLTGKYLLGILFAAFAVFLLS